MIPLPSFHTMVALSLEVYYHPPGITVKGICTPHKIPYGTCYQYQLQIPPYRSIWSHMARSPLLLLTVCNHSRRYHYLTWYLWCRPMIRWLYIKHTYHTILPFTFCLSQNISACCLESTLESKYPLYGDGSVLLDVCLPILMRVLSLISNVLVWKWGL